MNILKEKSINFDINEFDSKTAETEEAHNMSSWGEKFSLFLFPDLPEYFPFRKKVLITKTNSAIGTIWDTCQLLFTFCICFVYAFGTYDNDYSITRTIYIIQIVMVFTFLLDFMINLYLKPSILFFADFMTFVDILCMLPILLGFAIGGQAQYLNFLFSFRILKLIAIFDTYKPLKNMGGVKKQIMSLILTLVSLIFIATVVIQFFENLGNYNYSDCKFINANTNWQPSCSSMFPYEYPSIAQSCDCVVRNCRKYYIFDDNDGEPSRVVCPILTFYDCFYFIMATISTIGYGDISPLTRIGKGIIIIFIIGSLIMIPIQVNELQVIMSLRSQYRIPYQPLSNDCHVIVCGYVNSSGKLERFFEEFFHSDRTTSSGQEYHAVILSPLEPSEDVRAFLQLPILDSKITYVQGSALSAEDLKRVRADRASCVFFLCNTEVNEGLTNIEDAATVLRTLSVSNFNPNVDCLVQVLRPEDRSVLKDSDVDVILCLDEFKTALQARNSVCPGFSTFIENIFHSMENVESEMEKTMAPWYQEYLHGAGMEIYFISLDENFLKLVKYSFKKIAEAFFIEFGIVIFGVTDHDKTSLVFNPDEKCVEGFSSAKDFYKEYCCGVIMADDQYRAEEITRGIADASVVNNLLRKIEEEEINFPCTLEQRQRADSVYINTDLNAPNFIDRNNYSQSSLFSILGSFKLSSKIHLEGEENQDGEEEVDEFDVEDGEEDEEEDDDDDVDENEDEFHYIGFVSSRENIEKRDLVLASLEGTKQSALFTIGESGDRSDSNSENDSDDNETSSLALEPSRNNVLPPIQNVQGPALGLVTSINKSIPSSKPRLSLIQQQDYYEIEDVEDYVVEVDSKYNLTVPYQLGRNSVEFDLSDPKCNISCLKDHIVVYGSDSNFTMFVAELRRPEVSGPAYHPILYIGEEEPLKWGFIQETYADIYFVKGNLTDIEHVLSKINIKFAYSLVLLAARGKNSKIDEESIDAPTLFAYLKIESNIPENVFCTVELNCASNMSVLNATIMRKSQITEEKHKRKLELEDKVTDLGPSTPFSTISSPSKILKVVEEIKENATNSSSSFRDSCLGSVVDDKQLWEKMDSHHVFPVFASAFAFVPSSFESILVQSFYVKITPVICEKFVCGQTHQTVMQNEIPNLFLGKYFIDMFRLFITFKVLCFGLYRAPQKELEAVLPYIYISPPADTLIAEKDRVFIFGSVANLNKALKCIEELAKFERAKKKK
jgi:hypothetical protein